MDSPFQRRPTSVSSGHDSDNALKHQSIGTSLKDNSSRKRTAPVDGNYESAFRSKRQKTATEEADKLDFSAPEPHVGHQPTLVNPERDGLKRSIALVLGHVGFESATPEALEGFAEQTENCAYLRVRYFVSYSNANVRVHRCLQIDS